jgi:ADP-heptose:LPS heptosyltransferase
MKVSQEINICIIRNDKMGDMILTLPIIKAIKDSHPNTKITVVCSNINSFLCEEASFVDEYSVFDKKDKLVSKIKFLTTFRKNSFDFIFNFSQDIETFLLLLIAKSVNKSSLIYLSRYRNPKFSKIFQRLFIKLVGFDNIKINRHKFYKKKIGFHQTEIMCRLVNKKLNIKKPKLFHLFPSEINFKKTFQKRILIHLSDRWIDHEYCEDMFLKLLSKLEKRYGKLYLTTDQSSHKSFQKIYELYEKFNDSELYNVNKSNQNVIILDKLNFKNWRNVIINSKLVITYECGCVHVASMSDVPLLVIYDYKNKPNMIHKEYAPLTTNYQKVITNQKRINAEVMIKLEKMKSK